jgi:hypothetical protein
MVTGNTEDANSTKSGAEADPVLTEHGQKEHALKEERFKDTLSLREIISGFYKRIGQARVPKAKRERAEKIIQELLAEGYSLENIQFAAQWTPDNAKEQLYDFSILEHTIEQAMAVKKKIEAREQRSRELEQAAELDRIENEQMEADREKAEAHKSKLDEDQREELRDRALKEIRSTDGIKEDFISEALVASKENEILKGEVE